MLVLPAAASPLTPPAEEDGCAESPHPVAARPPLRCYELSDGASVWVQETNYEAGGLGWRVWPAAGRLCARLSAQRSLLDGRSVLELGAGVGLVGLAASQLGGTLLRLKSRALVDAALPARQPRPLSSQTRCRD